LYQVRSERQAFEQAASASRDGIVFFSAAVEQGDRKAIFGAFTEVGDACKGCNDDLRRE